MKGRWVVAVLVLGATASGAQEAAVKLNARVFLSATGTFEPLELRAPGEPAHRASYVQFALDPRIPSAVLLNLQLPASAEPRTVRVAVKQGRERPRVRWVPVPPALALDKPRTVHTSVWLDEVNFCQDLAIEISLPTVKEPVLERVIGFACGE